MSIYADTSFLVSLYIRDANSEHAARLLGGNSQPSSIRHQASVLGGFRQALLPILLTPLGELELSNAFRLRLFRKELVARQANRAHRDFMRDAADGVFERKEMSTAVFDTAMRLVRKHTPRLGVRTLDILHVASALVLQADTFCTFDRNQARLAKAERLTVISLP